MIKNTLLIIDDKRQLCETLARSLSQLGYHTLYATNGTEALKLFSIHPVDVVLLDIMLGEEHGIDVLQQLLLLRKDIPVIMITGYASIETAVQSIKLGAFDYIKKPLDPNHLVKIIERALRMSPRRQGERQENEQEPESFPHLVTHNAKMLEICDTAKKLAATDLPVLISGENGTGKEIIADFIHHNSARHGQPMVKINCAAFPETLLENELFGHEKGAYTGADTTFKGVFERAGNSSLFLDEIGDMPLAIQAKILRTLQNREIRRLGGHATITTNVRFIAATNKDLKKLMDEERFRVDLYYRLKAAIIQLPPLRERQDDIPLLAEYFLTEYARAHETPVKQMSESVRNVLLRYHWPGNVRELKNALNYAAAISSKGMLELSDLPSDFPVAPQPAASGNIREEMEKNLIIQTLQKTDYNKKKTAELLNMSRKTLYSRLRKYDIAISQ